MAISRTYLAVIEASAGEPYLCLAIELDARTIADLISQSGDASWSRRETTRGLFVGEMDAATQDAVLRLARLLETPRDIPVLAPLALREFHYRLLSGPYGSGSEFSWRAGRPAGAAGVVLGTEDLTPALRTGTLNPHSVAIRCREREAATDATALCATRRVAPTRELSPEWPALW